jgi:hypothetical protein
MHTANQVRPIYAIHAYFTMLTATSRRQYVQANTCLRVLGNSMLQYTNITFRLAIVRLVSTTITRTGTHRGYRPCQKRNTCIAVPQTGRQRRCPCPQPWTRPGTGPPAQQTASFIPADTDPSCTERALHSWVAKQCAVTHALHNKMAGK